MTYQVSVYFKRVLFSGCMRMAVRNLILTCMLPATSIQYCLEERKYLGLPSRTRAPLTLIVVPPSNTLAVKVSTYIRQESIQLAAGHVHCRLYASGLLARRPSIDLKVS